MAREVFYKKSHKAWYVHFEGKYVRLVKGKDDAPTRRQADELYEEMKRAKRRSDRLVTPGLPTPATLGGLYADFLEVAFVGLEPRTKDFYREKLGPLVAHLGDAFPAEGLTAFHVNQWIAAHPDWKKGTARGLWQAVKRLMAWAEENGKVSRSPVRNAKKPGATARDLVITPEQYRDVIVPNIPGQHFRDLVAVAWETGARPQEFLNAEARHYDRPGKRLVFPAKESKGKKVPRVVYLTDAAVEIVERLVTDYPSGHIFRNARGRRWTTSSVNCEWVRLRHRLGFARMKAEDLEPDETAVAARLKTLKPRRADGTEKTDRELRDEARLKCRQALACTLAPKWCLYHFRHSWLDRMLKGGVDALTCAILMGHRDPSMVAKTYSHLSQSPDYLRAALNKAAG